MNSNIKKTNYWNNKVRYSSKCVAQVFMPLSKKYKQANASRINNVACGCGDSGCASCQPCKVSPCGCS